MQTYIAFNMPSGAFILEQITSGVVLVLILLLATFRNRLVEKAYDSVVRKKMCEHYLSDSDGNRMDVINTLVEQALYAMGAERACLIQFQNGEMFALANPAWKLMCTVERHIPGSQKIQYAIQGIPVTWWSDMIAPMLSESVKIPGVTPREHGTVCNGCQVYSSGLRRVLRHNYGAMPASQATLAAAETGMALSYTINLVNQKHRAVIGFLMFQYRAVPDLKETDLRICRICESARGIEAALTLETALPKKGLWKSLVERLIG